ncbi:MAG: hypothetical protein COA78_27295 [Blastopirellula sp.]|nr:MAG: hypothetical protein COA78_27295 [Blastopirellula sp.]
MFQRINLPVLLLLITCCQMASAVDWINARSYYTHDPQTGKATPQYTPTPTVQIYQDPTYVKSGYKHYRSTLRGNGSVDNMHIVEEWGRQVRPYGEWKRPYRPYSVPYSQWGAPFRGLGPIYSGYPGYPGYPYPVPPIPPTYPVPPVPVP